MSAHIDELPTLGVGASLSLSADPDPVSLVRTNGGPSFVEYAGLVDVDQVIDEVERIRAAGVSTSWMKMSVMILSKFDPMRLNWMQVFEPICCCLTFVVHFQ